MTDQTPIENALSPATRRWIYNMAMAIAPLLAVIGIANDGIIQNVLVVIAAALSISTDAIAKHNIT